MTAPREKYQPLLMPGLENLGADIFSAMRAPPANLQAEQCILGSVMAAGVTGKTALLDKLGYLKPEHFADQVHATIWKVIQIRYAEGSAFDAISLRPVLASNSKLAGVGDTYVYDLLGTVMPHPMVEAHARQVVDLARRREMIAGMEQAFALAMNPEADQTADDILYSLRKQLDVVEGAGGGEKMDSLADGLAAAILKGEETALLGGGLSGLSTGFPALDRRLGGLEDGTMTVLGARPGMGKTALGLQIGINAAWRDDPVFFASLEMSSVQLARRALALESEVPLASLRRGDFTRADRQRWADAVVEAQQRMAKLPLHIADTPQMRMEEIEQAARAARRKMGGLRLVVVDHMHIVGRDAVAGRFGETQALTEVSGACKKLAKRLGVPVLVLAQLSRGVEGRDDKRPSLADLRQSGAIEQDADTVLFLYREQYYLERAKPVPNDKETDDRFQERMNDWQTRLEACRGRAECIAAKVRDGETGTDPLLFDGLYTRFRTDLAAEPSQADDDGSY